MRARHPALSHAPNLGRFLSADTVAPGSAALTVWPSDGVAAALWATGGDGPLNPQELNRYAYVHNNPVKNTDPMGHCIGPVLVYCGAVAAKALFDAAVVTVGVYMVADGAQHIAQTMGDTGGQTGDPGGLDPDDFDVNTKNPENFLRESLRRKGDNKPHYANAKNPSPQWKSNKWEQDGYR